MLPGGFSAHIPGALEIVMVGGVETSRNSYMQLSLLPAHLTVMLSISAMTCASCTGFPPVKLTNVSQAACAVFRFPSVNVVVPPSAGTAAS
jgi:hypothetical protein